MSRVPKSIKSTQQILRGSNHILHSLYAQSQDLRTIQQIVDNVLDVETSVASLKNNELTLLTAKSTQATQTRYRQRTIISALRRRGLEVSSLKIKVQPIFSANKKHEDSERYMTPQNASRLQQSAACIEDEALKNALIKLSNRTRGD
ncbi:DUF721 domain-containing protein [Gammaproteobacteria bacterium]|nr:DUF721 domain-containing protein [Gammaproteobacteria bacterium]